MDLDTLKVSALYVKGLFYFYFFSLLHMIRDIFELHVPMSTYQMNAQLKH